MTLFHRLSPDMLISIAPYCSSLREFVLLLYATKLILLYRHGKDDAFWEKLLQHYLCAFGRDLQHVLNNYQNIRSSSHIMDSHNTVWYHTTQDLFTIRKCSRSGCYQQYEEWMNHNQACSYHPGKLKNNALTCCRERSFRSPGCKRTSHSGLFHYFLFSRREVARSSQIQEKRNDDKLPIIKANRSPLSAGLNGCDVKVVNKSKHGVTVHTDDHLNKTKKKLLSARISPMPPIYPIVWMCDRSCGI
eukprot:gene6206-6844_t